jgi:hypothetical protein
MSCLAIVGEGMKSTKGVAGRCFKALAKADVNVVAIAQGSSERNISVIINANDAKTALRAVHSAFLTPRSPLKSGISLHQLNLHTNKGDAGFSRISSYDSIDELTSLNNACTSPSTFASASASASAAKMQELAASDMNRELREENTKLKSENEQLRALLQKYTLSNQHKQQ